MNWKYYCVIIGVIWGLISIFLLMTSYVASEIPEDLPEDAMPPGDYSVVGKLLFFPAWASAQLTTSDGIIYATRDITGPYIIGNPSLFLSSIIVATIITFLVGFITKKMKRNSVAGSSSTS